MLCTFHPTAHAVNCKLLDIFLIRTDSKRKESISHYPQLDYSLRSYCYWFKIRLVLFHEGRWYRLVGVSQKDPGCSPSSTTHSLWTLAKLHTFSQLGLIREPSPHRIVARIKFISAASIYPPGSYHPSLLPPYDGLLPSLLLTWKYIKKLSRGSKAK